MKSIQIIPLTEPIKGTITIPGSKSYTNRALVMAAMTKGSVRIQSALWSDDTRAMIQCLQTLGIQINVCKDSIEVIGSIHNIQDHEYILDADLSGTTLRFLLPLLAIVPGVKILKGKAGLNKRPIKILVDALRQLGAQIVYVQDEGYPPLRILPSKLKVGTITLDGTISSQYFSALLMVAPMIGGLTVHVEGEQISKPYIDMTIDSMAKFGVAVQNKEYRKYIVAGDQIYKVRQYTVEGDFSSAGYFLALAALTKSTLTIKNLNPHSAQADRKILNILKEMGSVITFGDNEVTIQGKGIQSMEVDMIDFPDQAQTLAVLAALTEGTTTLSGIQSLRLKETERVVALQNELKKMGIETSSTASQLTIYGGNPTCASISTYGDHRMAMSFAVAGAKLPGMVILDPEVVTKTFPEFWDTLSSIGIKTEQVDLRNIVLIGMRGSGKTSVARLLSKKLHRAYCELDEMLVKMAGMSVPQIVEKHGWDYFRDQESLIVEKVSVLHHKIISTGGGVLTRTKNRDALKKNGIFIFLNTSAQVLVDRIGDDPNRPSLTNKSTRKSEIEELLKQRQSIYEDAADEIINTDMLSPEEVAHNIMLKMRGERI